MLWTQFNMQVDPEAARIVFESGVRLTMVPLEVTHTALVTTSVLQRVRTHQPSPFLQLMMDLLIFFAETYASGAGGLWAGLDLGWAGRDEAGG